MNTSALNLGRLRANRVKEKWAERLFGTMPESKPHESRNRELIMIPTPASHEDATTRPSALDRLEEVANQFPKQEFQEAGDFNELASRISRRKQAGTDSVNRNRSKPVYERLKEVFD